jgi:hypothetical protein
MKMTTESKHETVPTEMSGLCEKDNLQATQEREDRKIDWESFSDVNPNIKALIDYWTHRHDQTVSFGGQQVESDLGFYSDLKNQYLPFLTPVQTEFELTPQIRTGALSTAPMVGYPSHIFTVGSSDEIDKRQKIPPVSKEAEKYNKLIQQSIKKEKERLLQFKNDYALKGYTDWESFCREIAAKTRRPDLYNKAIKLAEVAAPFRDRIQDKPRCAKILRRSGEEIDISEYIMVDLPRTRRDGKDKKPAEKGDGDEEDPKTRFVMTHLKDQHGSGQGRKDPSEDTQKLFDTKNLIDFSDEEEGEERARLAIQLSILDPDMDFEEERLLYAQSFLEQSLEETNPKVAVKHIKKACNLLKLKNPLWYQGYLPGGKMLWGGVKMGKYEYRTTKMHKTPEEALSDAATDLAFTLLNECRLFGLRKAGTSYGISVEQNILSKGKKDSVVVEESGAREEFFVALENFCAPAQLEGIRTSLSTDVVPIYQVATCALFAHALELDFDVSGRWNSDIEDVMSDFWTLFIRYLEKLERIKGLPNQYSITVEPKGYVVQPHAEMPAPSKYIPTGYFSDLTKIGTENLQTLISSVRLNLPEVEGQQVLWAAQKFSTRGLTHACLTVPYMKLLFYYNTRFARGDYTSGTSPGIWTNLAEADFVKGTWWPLSPFNQVVWPVFQARIVTLADLCSYMAGKMGSTPGYEPDRLGKDVAVIPITKRMQFDLTWWVTAFMEYPINDFTQFIAMNRVNSGDEIGSGWGRPLTSATRIVGPATRALFVLVDELGSTSISKGSKDGYISSTYSINVWGATVSAHYSYLFGTDQVPTPITPSLDDFSQIPPLVAAITYMEGIISREDAELARDLLAAFSHLHTVAASTDLMAADRQKIRSPGQANLIGANLLAYHRAMTPENAEFCTGNHLVNAFKMHAISREDQRRLRHIHMYIPDGFWMANLFAFGGYIKAENPLLVPWGNFYHRLAVNSVALCHLNDMIDMKAGSTCLTLCPYMISRHLREYADIEEYSALIQTRNAILPQIQLLVNYDYVGSLRDSYISGFQNTYYDPGWDFAHINLGRPICYPLQISVLFGANFELGNLDSTIRCVNIFSEHRRTYDIEATVMGYRPDMSQSFANESRYWKQAYTALSQDRILPIWMDPSGRQWFLGHCCHLFLQSEAQRKTFSIPNTHEINRIWGYLRPFYEPDLTYHLEWHSNPTYWWRKSEFQSIIWGNVNNKDYVLVKPVRSIPYHVANLVDQQNRPAFLLKSRTKLNF